MELSVSTGNAVPGRHDGRVALVTGGASGIGEAVVRRLVSEGARVVISDVQTDAGTALAAELGDIARFIQTDVTDENDVAAAVDLAVGDFGGLDIAVANAGILGATGSILSCAIEDVTRTILVDLVGVYTTIKHAARVMVPRRSGTIVATSSPAGVLGGVGPHAYSAAKAGVLGLVRSAAGELRYSHVRVNAVIPGAIVTAMSADIEFDDPAALDRAYESLASVSPMARPGLPSDLAAAVSYLASDDGYFVTGHALAVDAGMTTIGGESPFTSGEWASPRSFLEAGRRG